jgi:hypothetical protein
MRLWEIAGALLVMIGLFMFYLVYDQVVRLERPLSAGALVLAGIIIFRGGIQLLKVAAAVHACREYRAELREQQVKGEGAKRRTTLPQASECQPIQRKTTPAPLLQNSIVPRTMAATE